MLLQEGGAAPLAPGVAEQVEIAAKYQGYIERQQAEVARQRAQDDIALPDTLDYRELRGLSKEVQTKLNQHKPASIAQASRIQGVTPAAVSLLRVYAKRGFVVPKGQRGAQADGDRKSA
jgi:tRNA uridine 5-carboxymethylaminomethyl modification enzyme